MTDPIVAPSTAPKPITTKQLDALTKVWDLNMNKSGSIKNKDFKIMGALGCQATSQIANPGEKITLCGRILRRTFSGQESREAAEEIHLCA